MDVCRVRHIDRGNLILISSRFSLRCNKNVYIIFPLCVE